MSVDLSDTDLRGIDDLIMDPGWYETTEYHDALRMLRDQDPVHWVASSNYDRPFWAVTRYDDVKWCFQNNEILSSREGARMPRVPARTTAERRLELGYDTRLDCLDDPIHAMYRRPLNKHFSVPAVKRLGPEITSFVNDIIDDLDDDAEFSFVDAVATRLPVMVVSTMLGIPREEWPLLQLLSSRVIESHDPRYLVDGDPVATYQNAYNELMEYSARLIADRRATPRDDFATVLGGMKIDHEPLSPREARTTVVSLILGGFDTTRHAIDVGTWQILEHPDQRQALLDDPSLLMGAVDETLRYANPGRASARVANEDFELNGKLIRAGDWVSLMVISANRDERQFDRPLEFDITRSPNEFLSFGEGVHKCLGRNLIRLELAAFYPVLFSRMPELRVVGEPQWLRDTSVNGLASLNMWSGKIVRARSDA